MGNWSISTGISWTVDRWDGPTYLTRSLDSIIPCRGKGSHQEMGAGMAQSRHGWHHCSHGLLASCAIRLGRGNRGTGSVYRKMTQGCGYADVPNPPPFALFLSPIRPPSPIEQAWQAKTSKTNITPYPTFDKTWPGDPRRLQNHGIAIFPDRLFSSRAAMFDSGPSPLPVGVLLALLVGEWVRPSPFRLSLFSHISFCLLFTVQVIFTA